MPLGWERINVKRTPPNKNIVFIKPLPGPDVKTAEEFLERIAAQCLPIMNRNHLAVVSLEEYEPNLEFWGEAFNAIVFRALTFGDRSQLQQWRSNPTRTQISVHWSLASIQVRSDGHDA
jgi:hypothetical protein